MAEIRTPLVWDSQHNQQRRNPVNGLIQGGGSGYVRISNVAGQAGAVVGSKVFQDSPNDSLIQSCVAESLDVDLFVKSSYPKVFCLGQEFTLAESGSGYVGQISITLPEAGDVVVYTINGDNHAGAYDTVSIALGEAPAITSLSFTGAYPAGQTELKAGDTFQVSGETDSEIVEVQIVDFGAFDTAIFSASGTTFTVTGVVANRGTTAQALPARVRVKNATGIWSSPVDTNAMGGTTDGADTVLLNNLYPSVSVSSIEYPAGQEALKDSENALINVSVSNTDTINYTSPNSQLSIASPTVNESQKAVTRIAGDYNVSTENLRITANRTANGAVRVVESIVQIAHTVPVITVTLPAARLRSGGNMGTSAQVHTVTLNATQNLIGLPVLDAEIGLLDAFTGSGSTFAAPLTIHDDDAKGTASFLNLGALSLSGQTVSVITNGETYEVGGFVNRTLTVAAWPNREALIGTDAVDTAKLRCTNLSKGVEGSLNFVYQASTDNAVDRFTITNNDTWYNCDLPNSVSNTTGTMLIEIEEII
jgi:hypothetical protein